MSYTRITTRIKRWIRRYAPILLWIGVALATGVLALKQPQGNTARGIVDSVGVSVVPSEDGIVRELTVGMLENVKAGQVIAMMDDRLFLAGQATAEAELAQLRAQLDAEQEDLEQKRLLEDQKTLDEQRRFAVNEETARLEHLQMKLQQEADMAELERLRLILERDKSLYAREMMSREEYDNSRLSYEALDKKVQNRKVAIDTAVQHYNEAKERRNALNGQPVDSDLQRILEPLRKAITVQESRIAELQERRKALFLMAPAAGQVTGVFKHSGETVMAGQPVAMLRLESSLQVTAYISERMLSTVPVGVHARLTSRYRPEVSTDAEVLLVGTQIEPLPGRLQQNPAIPEFGVAIVLGAFKEQPFYPGECVTVLLDTA